MKNKKRQLTLIWTWLIYVLYLLVYFVRFNGTSDGIFFLITSLAIILTISEFMGSFISNPDERLNFELKFYTPIIIGIFVGVVTSLYNLEKITNIGFHIIVILTLILMYGGFLFIEYKNKIFT